MSEDHVYLDFNRTAIVCAICQTAEPLTLPIPLSEFEKRIEPFLDAHKDCDFKC